MKSSIFGILPWTRSQRSSQSHNNNKPEIINQNSVGTTRSSESDKMREQTTVGYANHRPPSQSRNWNNKRPPLLRLDSEGEQISGKSFCDRAVSSSQLKKLNNCLSTSFDSHTTATAAASESVATSAGRISLNKSIPCHQSFKKSFSDPSGLPTNQSFPPPSFSAISRKFSYPMVDALSMAMPPSYSSHRRLLGCVNIFGVNSQDKNIMPCTCAVSSSPCANIFLKDQMNGRDSSRDLFKNNVEKMNGFKLNVESESPHSVDCDKNQNTTSESSSVNSVSDSSQALSQSFQSNDSSSVLVIPKKKRRRSRNRRKKVQNQDVGSAVFRPSSCSSPLKQNFHSQINSSAIDVNSQDSSSSFKACTSGTGVLNVKIVSPIHHMMKSQKGEHSSPVDASPVRSPATKQNSLKSTLFSSHLEHSNSIDEDHLSDDDLVFEDSSSVVFFEDSPTSSKSKLSSKKRKCRKPNVLLESEASDESDDEQPPVSSVRFTLSLTLSEDEENDSSVDWDISASPLESSNQFVFGCEFNTGLSLDAIICQTSSDCPETRAAKKRMRDLNAKWNEFYSSEISLHSINQRKIHFADDEDLVTVHLVGDEDRAGEWQRFACERERFKRRVAEVEKVLSPILCENHRAKAFSRMMQD